jgi:uncharacterized membrane protein YheB (UPF0754 family)
MKEEVHRGLEIQGQVFLDNAIRKLSSLQRFFISAGQYDRTLRERMPELIDDLIGQLETLLYSPDTRRRLIGFAEESLRALASREASLEILSRIVSSLAESYFTMPLGEALKKLTAGEDPRTLILRARELAGQQAGAEILSGAVNRMLDGNRDMVLSDFLLIDGSKKEKFDACIGEHILKIADSRIEGILKSINIKTLVSNRVNSLDMVKVERLVLDVMAGQLKWINVFGAILGALIGGLQVLLSLFAW